jgi:hypothetical protein
MLSRIASNTLEQRQNDACALHKSNHRMTSMHVARRCACVPFRTGEQYLYHSISSITTLNDYEAGGERDWEGNTAPDGSSPKIRTVNDGLPHLECKYLMRWSQIKKIVSERTSGASNLSRIEHGKSTCSNCGVRKLVVALWGNTVPAKRHFHAPAHVARAGAFDSVESAFGKIPFRSPSDRFEVSCRRVST